MKRRNIVILGSTGSIGLSTLQVLDRNREAFNVIAIAANTNIKQLEKQYRQYHPEYIAVLSESSAELLDLRLKGEPVKILAGEEGIIKLAKLSSADIVVNAIVGAAGLRASLEVVKQGKALALANKESLVAGGPLFTPLVKKYGGKILPIDSEHSAIWQALACGKPEEVKKLIITASGGPFRNYPAEQFRTITPAQALKHPTWQMGSKITIDSATLANKGLEVIEAVALFQIPVEQVEVVVHPQSIIHSMVEFIDSSIIAQMSNPDMCLPITYALFWPDRVESEFGSLDVTKLQDLTFEPPDLERFPALGLAFEAARVGGTAPAIFNAANESAVNQFLSGTVTFDMIAELIKIALEQVEVVKEPTLDDILAADEAAREIGNQKVEKA